MAAKGGNKHWVQRLEQELRPHLLSHKCEAENEPEVVKGFKHSKPSFSNTPLQQGHSSETSLGKAILSWRPRFKCLSLWGTFLLNYHKIDQYEAGNHERASSEALGVAHQDMELAK